MLSSLDINHPQPQLSPQLAGLAAASIPQVVWLEAGMSCASSWDTPCRCLYPTVSHFEKSYTLL